MVELDELTDGGRQADRHAKAVLAVAILLALLGLSELRRVQAAAPAMDFYAAWAVAQNLGRSDLADPYSRDALDRIRLEMAERLDLAGRPPRLAAAVKATQPLLATATPFLYSVFSPLARGTYESDVRRFQLVSLGAFGIGVISCGLLAGLPMRLAVLWLAVAGLLFQPVRSDVDVANVNPLLFGLLAIGLLLLEAARRQRDRWPMCLCASAGLVFGCAVALKPLLILVPLALVVRCWARGDWRSAVAQALGAGVSLVACVAWSSVQFGSLAIWPQWLGALSSLPAEATAVALGNVSPVRWLADLLGVDPLRTAVVATLGLGAAAAWALGSGSRPGGIAGGGSADQRILSSIDDLRVSGLALALVFIASPLTWLHYLVLLLPVFPIADVPVRAHPVRGVLLFGAFCSLALRPIWLLGWSTNPPVPQAGLCVLFCLLLFDVAQPFRSEQVSND